MSWLYSRALVEEFSAATCSDGAQSAQLSLTTTQQAFLSHGRTTERSRLSRYGMTLGRLMDARGEELLTWYREDSRARTSARPAKAQASTESAQDSGVRWHELSVRFDRATSSWRTHRRLWDEELIGSSVTFPRWGMTVNGVLWARGTPALPTFASARGSSRAIPTPRANDAEKHGNIDPMNPRNGLAGWVLWPTPRASPNENRQTKPTPSQIAGKHGMNLATAVQIWQTPTADDALNRERGKWNSRGEPKLSAQVMLPTPTVQDAKNNGAPSQNERNSAPLNAVAGGKLNPRWVEWLMEWPIGWTDYAPLETDRFQQWRDSHGNC